MTADKAKMKATAATWRKANPDKIRKYNLQGRHKRKAKGLKQSIYRWKHAPYGPPSFCEACEKPLLEPCLDHCHNTGLFRGWLCRKCNAALGLVGDTPEGAQKLLNYITKAYAALDSRLLKM